VHSSMTCAYSGTISVEGMQEESWQPMTNGGVNRGRSTIPEHVFKVRLLEETIIICLAMQMIKNIRECC
jgi:hypothetical protein